MTALNEVNVGLYTFLVVEVAEITSVPIYFQT